MPDDWDSDERLLADLADALRERRAVPESFVTAAKAAFTWHAVDAELAELAPAAPAGTRAGGGGHRSLTFTAGGLTVSVELTPDALLGQLVPPSAATVELCGPDGVVASTAADEVGWFTLRPAPRGLFRLRVRTGTGPDVHTEWTRA
ncbi:hypothetical protein [Amycolatopsis saalfeldensis]|uniref:Carboxypeptidase regulatory-like domain-containing protein n=1 Tax=Amycolatopsis saalfeldensis TaxID=394193 RepID=A0A1H8WZR5_9PSEU|nr:hypothetical protein [Amycolatopsis saalfeldensis]SEP33134.1 hypothetical protein SAMN04489732_106104 [Amycolatopsis saalfeldensis]